MHKDLITAEEARQLFSYNPDTGDITWRVARSGVRNNGVAGYAQRDGYRVVFVNGKLYLAHRVAWAIVNGAWPETGIDHINGNKTDNRWDNLRLATKSQNGMNRPAQSNNTSGYKGVSRNRKRWAASIQEDGLKRHLGTFDTPKEAHAAYCRAALKLYGEFARLV